MDWEAVPGWPYPSAFWLRSVQHYVAINKKLPAYLAGEYKPQDMDSRMGLAEVCFLRSGTIAPLSFSGEAVDAELEIFDMAPHFRLEAIQSAVLASDRQGEMRSSSTPRNAHAFASRPSPGSEPTSPCTRIL